jgi:hypothetical protein
VCIVLVHPGDGEDGGRANGCCRHCSVRLHHDILSFARAWDGGVTGKEGCEMLGDSDGTYSRSSSTMGDAEGLWGGVG